MQKSRLWEKSNAQKREETCVAIAAQSKNEVEKLEDFFFFFPKRITISML